MRISQHKSTDQSYTKNMKKNIMLINLSAFTGLGFPVCKLLIKKKQDKAISLIACVDTGHSLFTSQSGHQTCVLHWQHDRSSDMIKLTIRVRLSRYNCIMPWFIFYQYVHICLPSCNYNTASLTLPLTAITTSSLLL